MKQPSPRELRDQRHIWAADPMVQGSARWADAQHLAARGYGPGGSHTLGYLPALERRAGALPVTYSGDRHQMIVAPTRSGKGVSGAIMRLLEHTGSAVVVDPKNGELALRTAIYRRDILKQNVVLIDPFDVVASRLGFKALGYNPVERLEPFGDEAFDDAMLAAESCVIPDGGMESHWSGEAAALIAGLCLWSAEQGRPSFGHVRALLNASGTAFKEMVAAMLASPFELVRAAGGRLDNKEERELSGVLSTAHRNTHFLESPRLAKSLQSTGFDMKAIGTDTTVYIVLPGHRIRTAARWLRIVVGGLIAAVTTLPAKPAKPLLFIIEEMAALQRMPILEQAVGLMAGYGLQLLMIVQDFTQLRDLYRDRWESFPANSGTIQCFGTNDRFTAEYLSAVFGQTSVEQLSLESARERGHLFGDPEYRSAADSVIGRRLISPDELMALHPAVQVMKLAASRPFIGYRPAYFLDHRFRSRDGRPLWWIDPAGPSFPLAPPLRFTKPGIDLGAVLAQHLKVG